VRHKVAEIVADAGYAVYSDLAARSITAFIPPQPNMLKRQRPGRPDALQIRSRSASADAPPIMPPPFSPDQSRPQAERTSHADPAAVASSPRLCPRSVHNRRRLCSRELLGGGCWAWLLGRPVHRGKQRVHSVAFCEDVGGDARAKREPVDGDVDTVDRV
jgi:hypothetical protein